MRRMAPRKKLAETADLHIRAPVTLLAALDEWTEELKGELPGGSGITRTDLIRDLLQKAVDERQKARKGKTKR